MLWEFKYTYESFQNSYLTAIKTIGSMKDISFKKRVFIVDLKNMLLKFNLRVCAYKVCRRCRCIVLYHLFIVVLSVRSSFLHNKNLNIPSLPLIRGSVRNSHKYGRGSLTKNTYRPRFHKQTIGLNPITQPFL